MAGFYGVNFNFDGDSCINYDLQIYFPNGQSGFVEQPSGSVVEPIWDSINRQAEKIVFGTMQSAPMQFELTIGSLTPKNRFEIDRIMAWLCGRIKPCWLEILQCDLAEARFLCFINNPQVVTVGNLPYAIKCTVQCISPYAYGFEESFIYNITTGSQNIKFNNISADEEYLYPILKITPLQTTERFFIVNQSDVGRKFEFEFSPFPNGFEVINVDNKRQIITSNQGINRFRNFNKNWFRLVRGANTLLVNGNAKIEVTCMFPKRVGG